MRERPILFSAPMVRPVLAGTKTQTRRAMRDQVVPPGTVQMARPGYCEIVNEHGVHIPGFYCPYGKPGDRLWVREAWSHAEFKGARGEIAAVPERFQHPNFCHYSAEWQHSKMRWTPGIHMPRWASRILIEINDVRVERLQDISEADALAEGVRHSYGEPFDTTHTISDRRRYELLWEQINGSGSWATNPWVWAVSFHRLPPTGGISETPPGGSTA
ncbi:hypothetical protein [Variovorax sp. LT1R16]|uniref:hypothetical protein n=1 Tax=Variovorax sp. LT1R16 TaxID=3443728 RepID=UPI003F448F06